MKSFKLAFVSLLFPLVSQAVDLRQGDIYRGEILIGDKHNRGRSCLVQINEAISTNSDQYYNIIVKLYNDRHLIVNSKNSLQINGGRSFKARLYSNYLEAKGSAYNVSNPETQDLKIVRAPLHSLHINFLNQKPFSALILSGQNIIANCVNLRLERTNK